MALAFIHPLIGQPRPTLATLIERAEPEAASLLETARRLAAWRLDEEARARALFENLYAPPYVDYALRRRLPPPGSMADDPRPTYAQQAPPWHPTPSAVTRTDLLRALLATRFDELIDRVYDSPDSPRAMLAPVAERWRTLAGQTPPAEGPLALERAWARHWALLLRRIREPLDVSLLFGMLGSTGYDWLVLHEESYAKGLITFEEAYRLCQSRMATHQRLRTPSPPPLQPAYVDRHQGLATLDSVLSRSPGVFITARQNGLERAALLDAWLGRHAYDRLPSSLAERRYTRLRLWCPALSEPQDPLSEEEADRMPRPGSKEFQVHWLASHSGPADEAWISAETGNGYNDLRVLANRARAQPDRFSFIILATEDEHRELCTHVTRLSTLERLEVSPFEERDLLPLWFAQLPALDEKWATAAPAELLCAFMESSEEDRRQPTPEVIGPAIQHARDEGVLKLWENTLASVRRGVRPPHRRVREYLERYIGDDDRLLSAVNFVEALP